MKEFFFVLETPFKSGIVPDLRVDSSVQDMGSRASAPFLLGAHNVKVGETGLVAIRPPAPILEVDWGHAAIFTETTPGQDSREDVSYLVDATSDMLEIYQVDDVYENLIYSYYRDISPDDYPYMKVIGTQGVLVCIVGEEVIAFPEHTTTTAIQESKVVEDVCFYNDRMVLAGFYDNWVSPDDGLIDDLLEQQKLSGAFGMVVPAKGDFDKLVFIGPAQGGNERSLYAAEISLLTGYQSDYYYPVLRDMVRGGAAFFLHMDEIGSILRVEQFLSRLVVFGTKGVAQFIQNEQQGLVERKLSTIPPLSKHTICSSPRGILYIGTDYNLYILEAEHQVKKLGYKHLVQNLEEDLIRITFDHFEGDYYVSDGVSSIILSVRGATTTSMCPMGFCTRSGEKWGLVLGDSPTDFIVETNRINMRRRNINHLKTLSISLEGAEDVRVGIDAKYGVGEPYIEVKDMPLNKEYFCFPQVSGLDIKFRLYGYTTEDFNLGWIECRWRTHDSRTSKGLSEQIGGNENVQQE